MAGIVGTQGGGRTDFYHLALLAGAASGSTVYGTVAALRAEQGGDSYVTAYAIGREIELRVAAGLGENHAAAWDVRGTAGLMGGIVAAGLMRKLPVLALANAIGIAATMTIGHQVAKGTATATFHAGKAAGNCVLAALLAEVGFTGSTEALEAPRGFLRVLSPSSDVDIIVSGWGEEWLLAGSGMQGTG